MQKITLIAAHANNLCIGINNDMPWHLPEDFAFFKAYTTGKTVIMGRKTWESLPRKPLPNRRNIVITRQNDYVANGAELAADVQTALALCVDDAEVIIMGGAEIYRQTLVLASDLRITEVDLNIDGDAFFPDYKNGDWQEISRENGQGANGINFAFVHLKQANACVEK
ncbi:MAG: dihydrofolate reductase [Neisseria sp.]|nr:dihydrofolate reductase [Neisseria sp.]